MRAGLLGVAAALLAGTTQAGAQPKKLVNAALDARSAASGLDAVFRGAVAAQPQPSWIAYIVPAARGRNFGCDSYWRDGNASMGGGTVHLEPPSEVMVLYRVDGNQVDRIRTLAPDCDIDAGGVPLHWLADVDPGQSVALLETFVKGPERMTDSALSAIGMHAGPAADAALKRFVAADQPEPVRQKAVMWLGWTRGRQGFEALRAILASDPSDRVRERTVQVLASSKEPEALTLVLATAHSDHSSRVRGQALSWLARQAGVKAAGPIQDAIANDPEREVKRRAVSALREMPNGEGIPLLIQLSKTSRDPEVRKQAMSSLGASGDPRATAFFEEVLKSKP